MEFCLDTVKLGTQANAESNYLQGLEPDYTAMAHEQSSNTAKVTGNTNVSGSTSVGVSASTHGVFKSCFQSQSFRQLLVKCLIETRKRNKIKFLKGIL